MIAGTKAVDLKCPSCNTPAGEPCTLYSDLKPCRARVTAARNQTYAANRAARKEMP